MLSPVLIDLPLPILTPRLLIRPPQTGDGKMIYESVHESLKELKPWMPFSREDYTLEKAEENARQSYAKFILREDLRMLFFNRESGELIGSSGLHRIDWKNGLFMIGYWVRSSQAGKGYVTEVTNALTRYAFLQLKARRIEIRCNVINQKSRAIPERLGFPVEGTLKNIDVYASPEILCRDEVFYARTNLDGMPELKVSW